MGKLTERICKECGKQFMPRQATQIYCKGPHSTTCEVCGASFEYTCRPTERPKTCSRSCQEKLRSLTTMKRYGVRNVSELDYIKKKISEKNSSEEVKEKRRQTSLDHWGVDNPAKHPEVSRRMSQTMSSDEYLRKREATCLDRYGCSSPMQNDDVKAKQIATNRLRYNMKGHPHSKDDYMKMMVDPSKVDNYLRFKEDPSSYINSNYENSPTISQLEQDLGVTNTPIYNILIEANCRQLLATTYSTMEDDVVGYLKYLVPDAIIIRNDRTVIKPLELDIYLPEYNVAIECNPVATHNSSFIDPWGSPPKHYKYHQNKSELARKQGVFLFHIFGYEWNNKQNVIKSMLQNLLKCTPNKIGARSLHVVEVSHEVAVKFLDINHRQGGMNASVRLGLVDDNGEIFSLMTFNHPRNSLGQTAGQCEWELSRFCSKLNTSVVGAGSKLFKHFVKIFNPSSIVSYSDVAHTSGKLYTHLGFVFDVNVSSPSYVWVDKYDQMYFSRVACQKRNLSSLFKETVDLSKTEVEIMNEHGYAQVFDSGVIRWTWFRDSTL